MASTAERRLELLRTLYGEHAAGVAADLDRVLAAADAVPRFGRRRRSPAPRDERSAWLIAYPDHVTNPAASPLATLGSFVTERLSPPLTGVHTLPFHPATGDGGFSVVDPALVDDRLGTWDDLERLGSSTTWMADAVVNHVSASSPWLRALLEGDPTFADFFVRLPADCDAGAVARPRTSPLAHEFESAAGTERLWTTFSADQVDLDYRNPAVLLTMTEALIAFVDHGAGAIRLDAAAYLWKDPRTSSINRPEAHTIIALWRACLDEVAPDVVLVTETNVAHADNVAYLGSAPRPEAHAVYQFAVPPLVLHTMLTGSASALTGWLRSLEVPSEGQSALNFLASHDGVGLRAAEPILTAAELDALVEMTQRAGGQVNWGVRDGTARPYELASTWFSLMAVGCSEHDALARHRAAHAIALALQGIPLLYFGSLFADDNDETTFAATRHARDLNRRRFDDVTLRTALDDPGSRSARCWSMIRALLDARAASPAFHPDAAQHVLDAPDGIVAIERVAMDGQRAVVAVEIAGIGGEVAVRGEQHIHLAPWEVAWVQVGDGRGGRDTLTA